MSVTAVEIQEQRSKGANQTDPNLSAEQLASRVVDRSSVYAANGAIEPSELGDIADSTNTDKAAEAPSAESTQKKITDGLVTSITAKDFHSAVSESPYPTFVVVTQVGCAWCKKEAPVLDSIAEEYSGKVRIVTLDMGELKELPYVFNSEIHGSPTFVVFDQGSILGVMAGYRSEADLKVTVDHLLAQDQPKEK